MIGIVACPFSGENPLSFLGYDDHASTTAGLFTFTDVDLGEPHPTRFIIVTLYCFKPIASVTINGVAATVIATAVTVVGVRTAIAYAKVPNGATGNIVITMSNNGDSIMAIGWYRIRNIKAVTHTRAVATPATDLNENLNIPRRGAAVGIIGNTSASAVWTGLVKDFQDSVSGSQYSGASLQIDGQASPLNVTAPDFVCASLASFQTQ